MHSALFVLVLMEMKLAVLCLPVLLYTVTAYCRSSHVDWNTWSRCGCCCLTWDLACKLTMARWVSCHFIFCAAAPDFELTTVHQVIIVVLVKGRRLLTSVVFSFSLLILLF